MAVAEAEQVRQLAERYNPINVLASDKKTPDQNAARVLMGIYMGSNEVLSQIYGVGSDRFLIVKDGDREIVFGRGVTSTKWDFPYYDVSVLRKKGEDLTLQIIEASIKESNDGENRPLSSLLTYETESVFRGLERVRDLLEKYSQPARELLIA